MQQTHRDGLNLLGTNLVDDRRQARFVNRLLDRPVPAKPLADLERVAPWYQALGLAVLERVEVLAVVARDRVRVADALGHEQQNPRSLPLEE